MLVTSGRPVLYRGERVGRRGRFFQMLKFRTMKTGAEERIGQYLGEELIDATDAELTRVGRWLKASQLDEIPQLWNVLRGDMSFVGPRPIRPRFFTELAQDLPAYWQRLVVRPGLTGFAQVRRGYETSMAEKLAHDLEWIADRSVRLYLRTVLVTGRPRAPPDLRPPSLDSSAMCGICGIARTPRRRRPRAARAGWRARSPTAGPDSEGAHVDGPVGIAARRLAIIDLTGGDQPIANEDGSVVVVQNGEIYNYRELMHELERAGHTFRTRCDTEVLVHGYEQWGARLWERLRGMFAVAVWDARRTRLTLARDRFGIKPLYYRDVDGELSFASELDALPHGDIDLDAIEAFLAFNSIPAPLSIFRDIRKLAAGAHADVGGRARDARALRTPRPAAARATTRTRRSWSRSAAHGCATRCARI